MYYLCFIYVLLLRASVNSTASLLKDPSGKLPTEVLGNKTEGALLLLLANEFQVDYAVKRAEGFDAKRGDKMFTFSSERKRMSVLLVIFFFNICIYFYLFIKFFLRTITPNK